MSSTNFDNSSLGQNIDNFNVTCGLGEFLEYHSFENHTAPILIHLGCAPTPECARRMCASIFSIKMMCMGRPDQYDGCEVKPLKEMIIYGMVKDKVVIKTFVWKLKEQIATDILGRNPQLGQCSQPNPFKIKYTDEDTLGKNWRKFYSNEK